MHYINICTAILLLAICATMISCDSLVEELSVIEGIEFQDRVPDPAHLSVEIVVYTCEGHRNSLLVHNPDVEPIEFYRQDRYLIKWFSGDLPVPAESIWLDCVGAGRFSVTVTDRELGLMGTSVIDL